MNSDLFGIGRHKIGGSSNGWELHVHNLLPFFFPVLLHCEDFATLYILYFEVPHWLLHVDQRYRPFLLIYQKMLYVQTNCIQTEEKTNYSSLYSSNKLIQQSLCNHISTQLTFPLPDRPKPFPLLFYSV